MRFRTYIARIISVAFWRWSNSKEAVVTLLSWLAGIFGAGALLQGSEVLGVPKWLWGLVPFALMVLVVAPYRLLRDAESRIAEFNSADQREDWQGELDRELTPPINTFASWSTAMYREFVRQTDGAPQRLEPALMDEPFPSDGTASNLLTQFAYAVYVGGNVNSPQSFFSRCDIIPGAMDREDFEAFHEARQRVRAIFARWELRRVPGSEFEAWLDDTVRPRHFRWLKMVAYFGYPLADAMYNDMDLSDRPWYGLGVHWQAQVNE